MVQRQVTLWSDQIISKLIVISPPCEIAQYESSSLRCQELFDFIEVELRQREDKQYPTIRQLRKALHNQRDQLLAFAGVLDQKLDEIANRFEQPLQAVRDVCLLQFFLNHRCFMRSLKPECVGKSPKQLLTG